MSKTKSKKSSASVKKIKEYAEKNNSIRISYHEKVCAERMKTLFKAIDEMRVDIKNLHSDMNKGKGVINFLVVIGGSLAVILGFLNGMARRRQTASVGLYNELIAQANFAKDPNKIVFVPAMGKGPIDMVVLDIDTGEYQAYDVKSANYRKTDYIPKDKYTRKAGSLINRGLTPEQKKLRVKIYYNK